MSYWNSRCDNCDFCLMALPSWKEGMRATQKHAMATGHVAMLIQADGCILAVKGPNKKLAAYNKKMRSQIRAAGKA